MRRHDWAFALGRDTCGHLRTREHMSVGQSKAPRASTLKLEVFSRETAPLCTLCTKTAMVYRRRYPIDKLQKNRYSRAVFHVG